MKNKLLFIILIFVITLSTSGCNPYFTAYNDTNKYYGKYKPIDGIHADIKMYKTDSDIVCDGMIFLNSPTKAITLKNDEVNANLIAGCSDKKIIKAELKMRKRSFDKPHGTGIDQFDYRYTFETISKDIFKNEIDIKQYPQYKRNTLLKY